MNETVKLIVEIPKDAYRACRPLKTDNDQGLLTFCVVNAVADGTPLDDVKAEIDKLPDLNPDYPMDKTIHISKWNVMQILDSVGKGDNE